MARFKIGDHVKIVDSDLLYDTYSNWFKKYNYIDLYRNFKERIKPNTKHIFIIKGINFHTVFPKILLAAIQDLDTEEVFLINIDGIEKTGPSIENPVDIDVQYVDPYDNKKLSEYFEKNIFYHNSQMPYNFMTLREGINILKNNLKENNEMEILRLYGNEMKDLICKEYDEMIKKAKEEDEINMVLENAKEQIKEIRDANLGYDYSEPIQLSTNTGLTKETLRIINDLEEEKQEKFKKLSKKVELVEALFELTDDYNERIKILKNHKIIDKDLNLKLEI